MHDTSTTDAMVNWATAVHNGRCLVCILMVVAVVDALIGRLVIVVGGLMVRLWVHMRWLNVLNDGLTVLMVIGATLMRCGDRHMMLLVLVIRRLVIRRLLVMIDDDIFVMRPAGWSSDSGGRKGAGQH